MTSPRLPDKPWSWLVCGVGTFVFGIILGIVYTYAVFFPVFMDLFKDSSIEELSAVGSILQMLLFLSFPLCYMIMARINFKRSAVLSVVLCASSLLVTSFIEKNASILFITFSLPYGVGSSMLYISCVFAVTKYFEKRQNLAIGILNSGIALGNLIMTPVIQVFLDHFGLKTTLWILSGTVFSLILPVSITMDTNVKDATVIVENQEERQPKNRLREYFQIFKGPIYMIMLVTIFLQRFSFIVVFVYLVKYCIESGLTAQQGANQFIVIGVMSLVSCILAGRIMDHKSVNPFHVNQAATLLMTVPLFLFPLATKFYHFMIFSAVFGSGLGASYTTMDVLYINTGKKELLKYTWPTAECLTSIGKGVSPPILGFIIDLTGSYKTGFTTGAGVMMLSFLVPFLQYCFKPWREAPQNVDVPSTDEVYVNKQETVPSSDTKSLERVFHDPIMEESNNPSVKKEGILLTNNFVFDTKL